MNLNHSLVQKKKNNHGFSYSASNIKQIMGPPIKPPPRIRTNKQKSSSSSSTGTNWAKSCHSILNTSTLRSGSTSISVENESRVILALTEGRGEARCEVGLASIDLSMPTLVLCQISDVQSYINTLTKINILNPTDVIVPSTFLESENRMINKLRKKFPGIKILGIPRKTFNKSNGIDRILQLCLPSINTICVGLQHKYYALAAASALLTYLQSNLNIYYAKESINVSYQESEGYAVIDVSTADRLELVSSTKPNQATRYSTLFGVLNHCVTKVGARLLRSTILQPPSSPAIIEKTSHCVAELIKHPEVLVSIQAILQKISNIDQLLTLTSMNLGATDSCSVRQLNYLLLLNSLIDLIEPLKDVIESCQQSFFKDLKTTLGSENFVLIAEKIRAMIHPSAHFAKCEAGITQRCFAIKSNVNGLLDLVRKTYSERLNDLTEYVRHLGEKYNLPLTLGNNNTKGYHIVLKLNSQQKRTFKKSDLPSEFIQVYRMAGSCTMKTAELINYSTRVEDIMLEILKISNTMIYNLTVDLKQYMGFFYKLCEDIARLDMIQSLAEASRRNNYVRPKFGDFTELTNSRHPMLELLINEQNVENPISICQDFNVQIITGPNGSGKSIYIRQVMLLQIMAQVGCYVPADCAIFRPMSRMFARIYLEDDIEYGASSFILEMKEVKYMMTLLSENSLFIIDELCRSTTANEGAALAMAICEKFCKTSVFLYITTHYTNLTNLSNTYLNVKTWHMETIASGDTPQDLTLEYKFKLVPGVMNLRHYGVYVVKKIWPQTILEEVYEILDKCKKNRVEEEHDEVSEIIKVKYKLESDFRKLKSIGKLTRAAVNKHLNDYQNKLQKMSVYIDLSSDDGRELNFCDINSLQENNTQNQEQQMDLNAENGQQRIYLNSVESNENRTSYNNLSQFLLEDNDNINKLIPEISIASSDRVLLFQDNSSGESVSVEPIASQISNQNIEFTQNLSKSSECNKTLDQTRMQLTCSGIDCDNLTEAEIKHLAEELEIASRSFLEDDGDFEFTQESAYQTAAEDNAGSNEKYQHIFPNVKIIRGPSWVSTDSSQCPLTQDIENHQENKQCDNVDSESISYSPLESQSFNNDVEKTISNSDQGNNKTTSSSLHYMMQSQSKVNINSSAVTPSSNFGNISPIKKTFSATTENTKSSLVEKPQFSSDDHLVKVASISFNTKESSSSNSKQTTTNQNNISRRYKRFIPPKKLTRQEIEADFSEQDRRIYESSNMSESELSKYLEQKLNRPSIRQLQNSKHLAFVRRTDDGVEVFPAKPEFSKRKFSFKRNLSDNSNIDMSIFSDKNAKCFNEFMNSNERDVKRFKLNFETEREKQDDSQKFNFQPQTLSENAENMPLLLNVRSSSESDGNSFYSCGSFSPDGFYKQNKDDINNIVNKYLNEENDYQQRFYDNEGFNMFETRSFNEDDLRL